MKRIKISESGNLDGSYFVSMSIDVTNKEDYQRLIHFLEENKAIFESIERISIGTIITKNIIRVKFLFPETKIFTMSDKLFKFVNES